MLLDKSITFRASRVSQNNHINARKDVRGMEAIRPASSEERLAISETETTTIAVINILINIYIIS